MMGGEAEPVKARLIPTELGHAGACGSQIDGGRGLAAPTAGRRPQRARIVQPGGGQLGSRQGVSVHLDLWGDSDEVR
jgi:hypothetical protein